MSVTSLSKQAGFTTDAALAAEQTGTDFDPTKVNFGTYGFTAYARSGLGAKVAGQANGRPFIDVSIDVVADGNARQTIAKRIALYGPRDVIGIDPAQIVRREPSPGAVVGYGGTLAHIEFDKPELPWAFSPGNPMNDRLQPWIALVVVEYTNKVSLTLSQGGLPPVLTCSALELPRVADAWAWAHAQVMDGQANLKDKLTDRYGAQNLSRLICPRHLADEKTYLACVVPTFAEGRDAGLGKATFESGEAWPSGADVTVQLPVYDHWVFSTTVTADFEELARRLKPVVAPAGVGRRKVDVSSPHGPLADDQSPVQTLDCAVHSPLPSDGDGVAWASGRTDQLRVEINKGSSYSKDDVLPRVAPRLYTQFQRGQSKAPAAAPNADWFAGLNLDPLARVAAGLGTRVVRRDQEPLMRNAWTQVGAIEAANRALAAIQFGRFVGEAMLAKTIARANLSALAPMTAPVHGKIALAGGKTVAGDIGQSVLPRSAASAAFRKIAGPGSKAAIATARIGGSVAPAAPFAAMLGTNTLADLRRVYREPDGAAGLSAAAIATLPNVPARAQLAAGGFTLTPIIARIGAGQAVPAAQIDVVAEGARRREALLRSRVQNTTLTAGQRESLGGILAGIAASAPADLARSIDVTLAAFDTAAPRVAADVIPPRTTPASPLIVKDIDAIDIRSIGRNPIGGIVGRGGLLNRGIGLDVGAQRNGSVFPIPGGGPIPSRDTPTPTISPRQRFTDFGGGRVALPPPRTGATMSAARLGQAFATMVTGVGLTGLGRLSDRPASKVDKATLLAGIDPVKTATRYAKARITIPAKLGDWLGDGLVRPIMAAPTIQRPMYEALLDYDKDWLIPGLGQIDKTDFVTLLESNPRFIEGYMAGLSDEMGRELLWRNYPTDQRGTYFKRFWSREHDELVDDIHRWKKTPLGQHYTAGGSTADGAERVVLLVRGALIRKIPHALIVACLGTGSPRSVDFQSPPGGGEGTLLFRAPLDADSLLVGFDLTFDQIKARAASGGAKWWFLIAEHPTAPRFGLDISTTGNAGPAATSDDLDWLDLPVANNHLLATPPAASAGPGAKNWATNAAKMAAMLLQKPVRAAFDANELLGGITAPKPLVPPVRGGQGGGIFNPRDPRVGGALR